MKAKQPLHIMGRIIDEIEIRCWLILLRAPGFGPARFRAVLDSGIQPGAMIREFRGSLSGREVFAIPGSIHNPQERGCNALIRNGAKLVETKEDILEELPVDPSQPIRAIYT